MQQEIELARSEVRQEIAKVKSAASFAMVGAGIGFSSLILFGFGMVHLLGWIFPWLALWASFGIVALIGAAVAALFFERGGKIATSLKMIPTKTIKSMKENFEWNRESIS